MYPSSSSSDLTINISAGGNLISCNYYGLLNTLADLILDRVGRFEVFSGNEKGMGTFLDNIPILPSVIPRYLTATVLTLILLAGIPSSLS